MDPDPDWIRIQWAGLDPDSIGFSKSVSGSKRAKMTHKHRKKVNKFFFFLNSGYSLFRAEDFLCCLDILYGSLQISIAIFDQKKIKRVYLSFRFAGEFLRHYFFPRLSSGRIRLVPNPNFKKRFKKLDLDPD